MAHSLAPLSRERTSGLRPELFAGLALAALLSACSGGAAGALADDPPAPVDQPPPPGPGSQPPGPDDDGGVITIPVEVGDVVAVLELAAPVSPEFVLRATVPVPRGTFPRTDGEIPLAVLDHDGSPVVTQVEAVTFYPVDEDGADVVEVLARVRNHPGASPGDRIRYSVTFAPHPPLLAPLQGKPTLERLWQDTQSLPPGVEALLSTPAGVVLSGTDVFGHVYLADLLDDEQAKLYRRGPVATQLRTYNTMAPQQVVKSATGTLPHLFGVHAYLSTRAAEGSVLLDLRVNNGADGFDPALAADDALGDVYFESLELLVPPGWRVIQDLSDPFLGTPSTFGGYTVLPLVRPNADGSMHLMPSQGQFHRRLAIVPAGSEPNAQALLDHEGLAFCVEGVDPATGRDYWSWWSPDTARYFPQSHRLPSLAHLGLSDLRDFLRGEYQKLAGYLVTGGKETQDGAKPDGAYPVKAGVLGWAHPYGVPVGGMVGGDEISIFEGVVAAAAASNEGYRYLELQHRMQNDRMPVALYHMTGRPSRLSSWLKKQADGTKTVSFLFYNGKLIGGEDVIGIASSPSFQRQAVKSMGLEPAYQAELLSYQAIDYQHFVRYTRCPKALVWLGNDAQSKDDVLMAAESFRLGYHEFPLPGGGYQQSGLLAEEMEVAQDPGRGFAFGRAEGWGLDAVNAAYAMSKDAAWRRDTQTWLTRVVQLVLDGQAENGILQSKHSGKQFEDQFRFRHSIEGAIAENALRGMRETVWEGVDPFLAGTLDTVLFGSFYGLISDISWWPGEVAPWTHVALGPALGDGSTAWTTLAELQANLPLGCGNPECQVGHAAYTDTFQIGSSLAYAYELTGDPEFLSRALLHTKNPLPGQTLLQKLEADGLKFIENRAALLALAQDVEGP